MKNIDPKATPERRAALKNICEPESFLPIVEQCVDPEHAKKLRPHHMANFMALAAELFLIHYDGIGTAFERNNGLEVTFKLKLAPEKDNVELAFKPVDVFKDSASAPLPIEDPDQPDLFKKKPEKETGSVVEVESVSLLPSPATGLPAPIVEAEIVEQTRSEEEEKAYQEGLSDFAEGDNQTDFNPYIADDEPALYAAFHQGWMDKRKEHLDAQCVTEMLSTTAPKFKKMLENVFSNCITQAEYVGILNLALATERDGKGREWVISRLTEALTKTEQEVERTAFQQGEDAAGNEHITESANPYEPGTVDHDDWLEGFNSVRAGE